MIDRIYNANALPYPSPHVLVVIVTFFYRLLFADFCLQTFADFLQTFADFFENGTMFGVAKGAQRQRGIPL
ncbi:MAG: hypothetical protein FWC77_08555, partial [Defluviitaleaceae bacterium]|nr:hypothetical protein [Defluviitaleaceae bacterium]